MVYRAAVIVSMYESTKGTFLAEYSSLITSISASIINLISITILDKVIFGHYVFFPNVDCPTVQILTVNTPTYIEINMFPDQFIEINIVPDQFIEL